MKTKHLIWAGLGIAAVIILVNHSKAKAKTTATAPQMPATAGNTTNFTGYTGWGSNPKY